MLTIIAFFLRCSIKAIEAAIQARQWNKAVQIVELQDDNVAERLVRLQKSYGYSIPNQSVRLVYRYLFHVFYILDIYLSIHPVSLGIITTSLNTTLKSKSTRCVCSPQNLLRFPVILRLSMLIKRLSSCFQLAEKYFVKGGDPRAAIEMYTKANMYEAAHKVSQP